jgi:hypothetical protein
VLLAQTVKQRQWWPESVGQEHRGARAPKEAGKEVESYVVRSRRKITFPNLRDGCTILDESSPCFAWEYLGALVRCRCPVGIDTRSF